MLDKIKLYTKYYSRYFLILLFVAMGSSLFYGLTTTGPLMRDTADRYLNEFDLEDIKVISSHGIDEEELAIINNIEDLSYIELGYQMDMNIDETKNLISVESIPESWIKFDLVRGEFPKNTGEIAIDSSIDNFTYEIGDEITLVQKGDNPTQRLKNSKYKIVGFIRSPEYILSSERGASSVTGSKLDGYALIMPEDFDILHPTFARIHLNTAKKLSPFTSEYRAIVDNQTFLLREAFNDLPSTKIERIKQEATTRIAESQKSIDDLKKELSEISSKLERETKALEKLKSDYENKKKEYDALVSKSNRDIEHGQSFTKTMEDKLKSLQASYEQTKLDYDAQSIVTADLLSSLTTKRAYVEGQRSYLNGLQANLDAEKSQVYDGLNENSKETNSLKRSLAGLKVQLSIFSYKRDEINLKIRDVEGSISRLESQKNYLDSRTNELSGEQSSIDSQFATLQPDMDELNRLEGEYSGANEKLTSLETSMNNLKKELDDGTKELDTVKKDYEKAKNFLEKDKDKMEKEVKSLEDKYNEGNSSLVTNTEGLDSFKTNTENEIKNYEDIINRSKEELSGDITPIYRISNSGENQGMKLYFYITKRVDMISFVFPAVFLAVSLACVWLITGSVVSDDRRLLLPWTTNLERSRILSTYLKRILLFAGTGLVAGILIGNFAISRNMFRFYEDNFTIKSPIFAVYPIQLLIVTLFSALSVTLPIGIKWSGKAGELKPKNSFMETAIWLEKFPNYWTKISKYRRVSLKNLYATPVKYLSYAVGIAFLTGLLFLGLSIRSSIASIPELQYNQIMKYDAKVFITPGVSEEKISDFNFFLSDIKNARQVEKVAIVPAKTLTPGLLNLDVDIVVPQSVEGFEKIVTLSDATDESAVHLHPNAAVITKKLADMKKLNPGDKLQLTIDEYSKREVIISKIVENYVNHYIYLTPEYYKEVTGADPVFNTDFVVLKDNSTYALENFENESARYTPVQSIQTVYSQKQNTMQQIKPIEYISNIYILSTIILLYFTIRYVTYLQVKSRLSEVLTLANDTLEAGEYLKEINRQNLIMVILGMAAGLGIGILLFWYTVTDLVPDSLKFVPNINWLSFVITISSVLILVWLSQLLINAKLQKQGKITEE